MHNIPTLILAALVAVAWRREIIGAIAFFLAGMIYLGLILINVVNGSFEWYMASWTVIISGPAFVTSYLFFLNWRQKNRIHS